MAISVFDLFKIGIGPSSSHTVGPMRAARLFAQQLEVAGELEAVATVKAELFGSLGATGNGHGSDKAVILGLEGEAPETVDTDAIEGRLQRVREAKRLSLLGRREIPFSEGEHLVLHRRKSLPYHPNGMRFTAFAADGGELRTAAYYSVGGGFVVDEEAAGADRIKPDDTVLPYRFHSGDELLRLCATHGLSISQLMLENEKRLARRGDDPARGCSRSGG